MSTLLKPTVTKYCFVKRKHVNIAFRRNYSCKGNLIEKHSKYKIMVHTNTMEGSLFEPTLYIVKGMCILDNDGNRILAKYYDKDVLPTTKEQKAFEKNLFNKTHRANAEIIMLEGLTCVYKSNVDLFFYVMGSSHENELILQSVLNAVYESVSILVRRNVERRVLLDNLDAVMLALDEICDGGVILDADPTSIVGRAALRTEDVPLGEQTVAQVLQSAKEQLKWSLLK